MSLMLRAVALTGLLALVACERAQPAAQEAAPREPYKMVYTMASPTEVTLLDLNSVTKTGEVAEAWSLTFLAEPVRFEGAPREAQVFWVRARLDCATGTGQFVEAIGLHNGQTIFTVPIKTEPTPLATAWPLDEEFICENLQGARTAAATFAEAVTAARNAMTPPATTPSASGAAMAPLVPDGQ
ncbi:hypothetical protein [Brevundimonas sp.]|uniref:hypothetical protein n=1 Tax=Brevundimonas sp. TaxID=1871086 RepID=UPI00286AE2C2|nr:hypothetical protein [Brevundimonas sp.]